RDSFWIFCFLSRAAESYQKETVRFSVDSGMSLIRKGELTIVSGAPRGGFSGQVAFLKADPVAETNLLVEQVLSGPGLASSFGYDLTVVDLNADG
uniref:Uncharacterized protein n=1 Tax=Oryzias melastigma TaxID=30732 RepID=A0A3B3C0E5_ORYME